MRNLKPKKHLGQHFLTDKGIAQRITSLLTAEATDVVIEIGPGKGILSQYLFPLFPRFKMIEVDGDAVDYIYTHFEAQNPQVIHVDFLKWDMANSIPPDSFFIGNLPYNISSPIFFKFLDHLPYIKEGVFMIQKEVAKRICSPPGSKEYGILSVLLGAFFELEYCINVAPGSFFPPPKVQSGVIRMQRKTEAPDFEFKKMKLVVKTAFNQRRKTLRNALKGLNIEDFEGKEAMMSQRAEQLSVDDFIQLSHALKLVP